MCAFLGVKFHCAVIFTCISMSLILCLRTFLSFFLSFICVIIFSLSLLKVNCKIVVWGGAEHKEANRSCVHALSCISHTHRRSPFPPQAHYAHFVHFSQPHHEFISSYLQNHIFAKTFA